MTDIDDETTRLNRIVIEVLDFAKPLRFELAEARLNDVCRASADAAWAGQAVAGGRSTSMNLAADCHRRRAAPHGAREHPDQRPACRARRTGRDRRGTRRPSPVSPAQRAAATAWSSPCATSGAGIAPDDIAHDLRPLLHDAAAPGTGLGLPIAKNIIEGLGGKLAVTSRARRRHRDPHRAAAADAGGRMSPVHGSILLADDEEKILKRLGRALREEGHDVVEVDDRR